MAEVGILREGAGTELIEGRIYQRMSQSNVHITAVRYASRALRMVLGTGHDLSMQTSLPLNRHNEPGPDIVILRGQPADYDGRDPDPASDVVLVVEVSDSSLRKDRIDKVSLYAAHGVPEYWIIDLRHRTLEVRRRPIQGGYAETLVLGETESVAIGEGTIAVSALLPKAERL